MIVLLMNLTPLISTIMNYLEIHKSKNRIVIKISFFQFLIYITIFI